MNVMGFGATHGAFFALERMRFSNGGRGGRIVTTASYAGLMVQNQIRFLYTESWHEKSPKICTGCAIMSKTSVAFNFDCSILCQVLLGLMGN